MMRDACVPAVRIVKLVKDFGNVCTHDGVEFAVRVRKVTGFIGPNCAEKSATSRRDRSTRPDPTGPDR